MGNVTLVSHLSSRFFHTTDERHHFDTVDTRKSIQVLVPKGALTGETDLYNADPSGQ